LKPFQERYENIPAEYRDIYRDDPDLYRAIMASLEIEGNNNADSGPGNGFIEDLSNW